MMIGHEKRTQSPWRPFESKAFAAAIVLMVGVPIAIGLLLALRQRHNHLMLQMQELEAQEPRQQIDEQEQPRDNYYEDRYWSKVTRQIGERLRKPGSKFKESKLGRLLYCSSICPHAIEVLGDPENALRAIDAGQEQPGEPSLGPATWPASTRVDNMEPPGFGLPQNTIPPSGPPAQFGQPYFIPEMQAGAIGAGPFVRRPSTRAMPIPALDNLSNQISRLEQRSHRPSVTSRPNHRWNEGLNDNIPMAMPIWTSRHGVRPSGRSRKESLMPNASGMHDGTMSARRGGGYSLRTRREMVTSLLSGLRNGPRVPQNTELEVGARSPPANGQSEAATPVRTQPRYESPLEHMRRSHAMSHVIQQTQNFIGGYPDIACLIGNLPDITAHGQSPRPRTRKKARTTFL